MSRAGTSANLVGVVLAAGRSGRMGSLKQLLCVDGKAAVIRAAESFSAVGGRPLVVLGFAAERIAPMLDEAGVPYVLNEGHERGMYSSVVAGVRAAPSGAALIGILPVDYPIVRPETIGRLAREALARARPLVYPVYGGRRGHPPLLGRPLLEEVLTARAAGGLERVLGAHEDEAWDVAVDDQGVLLDMDEPADHRRIAELAVGERLPDAATCDRIHEQAGTPGHVRAHCSAVARTAIAVGSALDQRGGFLHLALLEAAARLHDIGRGERDHARRGADLLVSAGYARVAVVVAGHMEPPAPLPDIPGEREVLYLADKLVKGDRYVPLERRRDEMMQRLEDERARREACRRLDAAMKLAATVERLTHRPIEEFTTQ